MIKWIFKWFFRLFFAAVVLSVVTIVILVLSLDSILGTYAEHRLRTRAGVDSEIGNLSLGLAKPTLTVKNFKVYNPLGYGGTQFLDVREIHAEYDPAALKQRQLHIRLLRVNLAEFDVVRNQAGETNIYSIARNASLQKGGGSGRAAAFLRQTGLEFTGIDELNISIGEARFIDLEDPQQNRTLPIGIENLIIKNVKSPEDLAGLVVLIWLHGVQTIGLPVNPPQLGPDTNQ